MTPLVIGVQGSSYHGVESKEDARKAYEEALEKGNVALLEQTSVKSCTFNCLSAYL